MLIKELVQPKAGLAVLTGIILIVLLTAAVKQTAKRKRDMQLQKAAKDKEREERLEQRLENKKRPPNMKKEERIPQTPYEVIYQEKERKNREKVIKIELTAISDIASKKYLLSVQNEVFAGRNSQNDLVLNDKSISGRHCSFLRKNKDIYVTDLNSTNGTGLVRKEQRTELKKQSVKLKTGDILILGEIHLEVRILS